eukprot:381788-Rhodomonas_salina.1
METPYNDKNEWRIGLEREAGTIYMHVVQLEDSFSSSADQKKFQYWGYKFEELCCKPPGSDVAYHADNSDDAAKASGEDGAVNANVEFCSVFRMSFGHSRLIVAAGLSPSFLRRPSFPTAMLIPLCCRLSCSAGIAGCHADFPCCATPQRWTAPSQRRTKSEQRARMRRGSGSGSGGRRRKRRIGLWRSRPRAK